MCVFKESVWRIYMSESESKTYMRVFRTSGFYSSVFVCVPV